MIARREDAPTFALIGAAGYIAPKHGAAIKAVGGRLVAACDVHDAVGWLDEDWPECDFNFGGRWRGMPDWSIIVMPNHMHKEAVWSHLTYRNVICEKPLTLKVDELDCIAERERETGHRVYTIMNLRHHPEVIRAKQAAEERRPSTVNIVYTAPRGPWYDVSWKGDPARSGGIAFNIGIHIFDFLTWALGPADRVSAEQKDARSIEVMTNHPHALYGSTACRTYLSTSPTEPATRRIEFMWDGGDVEPFNLRAPYSLADDPSGHVACYKEILAGRGPGIAEARPGIELAERVNEALR